MPTTTPYGAWKSPISPKMLAGSQISFWGLTSDGPDVYWGEFRPGEGGRIAVMRWSDGEVSEIAPGFSARTLAHEYGGSSVAASDGRLDHRRQVDDLDINIRPSTTAGHRTYHCSSTASDQVWRSGLGPSRVSK